MKNKFMARKKDNWGFGTTIATWKLPVEPCRGSWSNWSKCADTTMLHCGHGTSFRVFSHTNANDHKTCKTPAGELQMKPCNLGPCPKRKYEEELEEQFLL